MCQQEVTILEGAIIRAIYECLHLLQDVIRKVSFLFFLFLHLKTITKMAFFTNSTSATRTENHAFFFFIFMEKVNSAHNALLERGTGFDLFQENFSSRSIYCHCTG